MPPAGKSNFLKDQPDTPLETVPQQAFEALHQAFEAFQQRADKLDNAYRAMQQDFRKLNLELDTRNRELADSLRSHRETQTYLNSILQSMNTGVIGIDIMGNITLFNRAAAEITGHVVEDVLEHSYESLFHDTAHPEWSLLEVLNTRQGLPHDEKVLWHKEGNPVTVSFQTSILSDPDGNTLGAVEIFNDITRLKRLEEQMQQARTMAALGEMSATVAHEIRNPLGAMGMWAQLLEREIDRDDPKKKTLSRIIEGLGRLNRIVSNLLVYSRPVKIDHRKIDLCALMEEIVDFVDIESERKNIAVTIQKRWRANEPVYISGDPEKLQQVVMNLCLNAVQAMETGGELTVEVERANKSADASFAYFKIIDTGSGIEPERIDRIFDPFHTSKEDGTGLGLAIVKKFIELHKGFIDVKSTYGTGTVVTVFLPALTTT